MTTSKLFRSRTDVMIGGVCSGLARYLGIDVLLVRLFFVLLALGNGIGVLLYVVLWAVVPRESRAEADGSSAAVRSGSEEIAERARAMGDELRQAATRPHPQIGVIAGAVLIGLGLLFLLQNLNIAWLWWLRLGVLWPVLLIIGGAVVLLRLTRGE